MFRKIFWINIGLVVIVLLLSYNFYKIWSQVMVHIKTPSARIEVAQETESLVQEKADEPDYMPSSLMSYSAIVEKDLFRPEREEWQPPPPPEEEEVEVQQSSPYPQYPGQPPQPEMKEPNLFGIIIIGESKKYAIMQGWTREEQKERTRKIRVGNEIREVPLPSLPGQLKEDNINAYRMGDYVSEAQVVDILPDKVIMEKEDGERYELLLREPTKLEMWKPSLAEGEQQPGQGGQIPGLPGGQPYPVPQGVPIYPYVPAYPVPPPGFVPPGVIPPQGRQRVVPQRQLPPNLPQQPQRNLPSPPGFPPGGISYPPGLSYPGPNRR